MATKLNVRRLNKKIKDLNVKKLNQLTKTLLKEAKERATPETEEEKRLRYKVEKSPLDRLVQNLEKTRERSEAVEALRKMIIEQEKNKRLSYIPTTIKKQVKETLDPKYAQYRGRGLYKSEASKHNMVIDDYKKIDKNLLDKNFRAYGGNISKYEYDDLRPKANTHNEMSDKIKKEYSNNTLKDIYDFDLKNKYLNQLYNEDKQQAKLDDEEDLDFTTKMKKIYNKSLIDENNLEEAMAKINKQKGYQYIDRNEFPKYATFTNKENENIMRPINRAIKKYDNDYVYYSGGCSKC